MMTLGKEPASPGLDPHVPSLAVAVLGFVGSTFLTAAVMVLLSSL
jgi:hypothetical protein